MTLLRVAMRQARQARLQADMLKHEANELERQAIATARETHTLTEIAEAMGTTKQRVWQILRNE